jgi:hypothetical protein
MEDPPADSGLPSILHGEQVLRIIHFAAAKLSRSPGALKQPNLWAG